MSVLGIDLVCEWVEPAEKFDLIIPLKFIEEHCFVWKRSREGYTVAKSGSEVTPHLYYNGNFYGDHDRLLSKYKNGELRKIGTNKRSSNRDCFILGLLYVRSEGAFAGELPIGMY
ncbi:hypothetical protein FOZ63_029972 [Perkinsus olseni]|uniref:Uncharacterized protein n=1 Tax=Perkinsus olseni TaxID=32597 RepID=A0A7J6S0T0_PEROL|nr:hypothetical protein FOZ63_029972 [Perkinsus olseni]